MARVKSRPAEPDRESDRGDRRRGGLFAALALAACSIVLPGVAHLRAGRRWTGALLLIAYLAVIAGAAYLVFYRYTLLLRLSVQPRWLTGVMYGAIGVAVLWVLLVWWSYRVLRPAAMRAPGRLAGGLVTLVLCAVACVPFAGASRYAYVQRHLVTSLFDHRSGHSRAADPWAGKTRVNILLLGGDAGSDRTGTRTDSMTLASVDVRTGATTLISLPRNLEHFHFAPGPAATRFPMGYTAAPPTEEGLLNEVYQYGEDHHDMVPGSRHPGADLLKGVFSQTLGVHVDYYALVDMSHFADIVNAMGGVWLRVDKPIPYGLRGQVIQPGYRKLHGQEALWYGRSRTGSSDYVRMGRQKCVLAAIARQANPTTVLTKFSGLAATAERTVSTDIPQDLLPALVQLSGKVRGAKISTLMFVPPKIRPYRPDWKLIRDETAKALSGKPEEPHKHRSSTPVGDICPAPGPNG
jgi:LCP family protein required for cell wall assembly